MLQLPLIASAESWSKIDSEGTLVGEAVAWVVAMATAGICCRCQVVFLLTRCDCDSARAPAADLVPALCTVRSVHAACIVSPLLPSYFSPSCLWIEQPRSIQLSRAALQFQTTATRGGSSSRAIGIKRRKRDICLAVCKCTDIRIHIPHLVYATTFFLG